MKKGRLEVPGKLITDYVLSGASQPARVHMLLHGYLQKAELLHTKFENAVPSTDAVLALNGPYPIPEKTESGYRVGFAWYFYDFSTDEYFIGMEVAKEMIRAALGQFGFVSLPKTIIGFSQGGYLAPFAALALENVTQVIGIGCRFLEDELPLRLPFRVDGIHGAQDEIVTAEAAQKSHDLLIQRGNTGSFQTVPSVGHRITPEVIARVKSLVTPTS